MFQHFCSNIFKITCFLAILVSQALGQSKVVTGKVFDNDRSLPFPYVSVMIVNQNDLILQGTKTGDDGSFRITVPEQGTKIVFSFIGYVKREIPISSISEPLSVVLLSDNQQLEEVSLTVQGAEKADLGFLTIDRREISSSIASVDLKGIENMPVASVDQLLQGMAPGLQVVAASGDPGAAASIRIRGISSISGINDPLWIVDGAEVIGNNYSVQSISDFGFSPIGDLDPSDIESVDVLKDASATALYGSKGANGVIVIKTKRGRKEKPQVNFNSRFTLTEVPRTIPMLSGDEQRIYYVELWTGGLDNGTALPQLRGDLSHPDAWMYNNNTNWMDQITRTGVYQQYNTSLSGGGDRINYYWGLGYTNQYGTTKGTGYDRFNTRFNLNYTVSDKVSISADLSYTNSLTDKRGTVHPTDLDADRKINPVLIAREIPAYFPVYSRNGLNYFVERNESLSYHSRFNPLAIIDYSSFLSKANRLMASSSLNWKIMDNLEFRTQMSADFREAGDEYFLPGYATDAIPGEALYNAGRQTEGYQLLLSSTNRMIWNPIKEENHRLTMTGVVNLNMDKNNSSLLNYNNGGSPELRSADASAIISEISGSFGDKRYIGMFLQGHYALKDRYFLTVTGKTEGDSRYGKDNSYSIFPAVGAAWELTKEPWAESADWISSFKPRVAYGITGNLPNIDNVYDIAYGTNTGYLGNTYIYPSKFAYDGITEERTTEYNFGVDWSLFNNRISGQFDYYTRTTEDLLLKETLSSTLGYATQYVNFGTVENSGVELGITADILRGGEGKPRLKSFFNIAYNRNKLISLPENFDEGSFRTSNRSFVSQLREGDVIGGFYGYRALGVYPSDTDAELKDERGRTIYEADGITPKYMRYGSATGARYQGGDMIFEDMNGDGIINDLDMVQIGDANPSFYGGWNNTLTYRDFTLTVNFQYQFGNDIINAARTSMEQMASSFNQSRSVMGRWRKQGDITDMPRAHPDGARNRIASTRWVEDGSYVRLKTVSFTYNADKVFRKYGLKNVSFFATAYNLYTWTNYLGVDPEVPITGSVTLFGIDNNTTAPPRQYTFGLRFNL